jgi:hypothetical protein
MRSHIPHRGKISNNSVESEKSKVWRVFNENVSWQNFADDSLKFTPQPRTRTVESSLRPIDGDVLARKPARNHVNNSAPRSAVKGANIIPDRERLENAFILSSAQYASGVGVDFDGTDGAPSEQHPAEDATSGPGE